LTLDQWSSLELIFDPSLMGWVYPFFIGQLFPPLLKAPMRTNIFRRLFLAPTTPALHFAQIQRPFGRWRQSLFRSQSLMIAFSAKDVQYFFPFAPEPTLPQRYPVVFRIMSRPVSRVFFHFRLRCLPPPGNSSFSSVGRESRPHLSQTPPSTLLTCERQKNLAF